MKEYHITLTEDDKHVRLNVIENMKPRFKICKTAAKTFNYEDQHINYKDQHMTSTPNETNTCLYNKA